MRSAREILDSIHTDLPQESQLGPGSAYASGLATAAVVAQLEANVLAERQADALERIASVLEGAQSSTLALRVAVT